MSNETSGSNRFRAASERATSPWAPQHQDGRGQGCPPSRMRSQNGTKRHIRGSLARIAARRRIRFEAPGGIRRPDHPTSRTKPLHGEPGVRFPSAADGVQQPFVEFIESRRLPVADRIVGICRHQRPGTLDAEPDEQARDGRRAAPDACRELTVLPGSRGETSCQWPRDGHSLLGGVRQHVDVECHASALASA